MSKCVRCGNELLTGDIHWNKGLCNNCYNDLPKNRNILNQNLENMFNAYSKILEEKDKKIKQLEDELTGRKKLCDLRYNQLKQANQEKINFAVEQLEKVKEKIQEDRESLINYNNASEVLMVDAFLCDCKNFIDNQIKHLKEME